MNPKRAVFASVLWIVGSACSDGGGGSPGPTAPPTPSPAPVVSEYQVAALSGSLNGTFDSTGLHFSGTNELRFRATGEGGQWEFVTRTSVQLSQTESGDWVGHYDTFAVQPVEVCPAAQWQANGHGFGNWLGMSLEQTGLRARVVLDYEGDFPIPFSGALSRRRLVTTLETPFSYQTACTPLS